MKCRAVVMLSLLVLGSVACTAVSTPTPTTESTITATAPPTEIFVEETAVIVPSSTATPQPTATWTPTSVPPTITPTSFPLSTGSADNLITNVILSSQGQLAYIKDEILYVETAPQSGEFEEIGRYAVMAAWSPDGSQLLYGVTNSYKVNRNDPTTMYDLRLWSVTDKRDDSFRAFISNYPDPQPYLSEAYWTPNGSKILLRASLKSTEIEDSNRLYHSQLLTVDLDLGTIAENQLIHSNHHVLRVTDDVYVLRFHCGSPCQNISIFDYSGHEVWSPAWATGGFVAFAKDNNFMVNVGRLDPNLREDTSDEPKATLDKIELSTGNLDIVWEMPITRDYFTAFVMPTISHDEQYFTFNFGGGMDMPGTLYVVDGNGSEVATHENSYPLGWNENGDLMIDTLLENGDHLLQMASIIGEVETIFTTPPDVEITGTQWTLGGGGVWSPDYQYFVFSTQNFDEDSAQIYLWNATDLADPYMIHSVGNDDSFEILSWLPDSSGIYFTSGSSGWGHEAVWFYDLNLKELSLVAPMSGEVGE